MCIDYHTNYSKVLVSSW